MIVELCGLTGAGKSTVARAVVTELTDRGEPATLPLEEVSARRPRHRRVCRKVRRGAVEALCHPREAGRTVGAVARSGQARRRDVAVRSLNWLVLRSALRRSRRAEGIHVFDQGVVQELGSVGFRGDARAALALADPGSAGLGPDLLVVVDVDPATAERRLAGRPGRESRLEGEDVDRRRELVCQRALLADLVTVWSDRFGHRVPTVVAHLGDGGPDRLLSLLGMTSAVTSVAPDLIGRNRWS